MTQIYQNKIVNVWLVLLWDNKYNFYFICRSRENQLQYLIFFFKRNDLNSTYMDAVVNFFDFIFRLSLALLALNLGSIPSIKYWLESAFSHGATQTVSLTRRHHRPPSCRQASAATDPHRCHCRWRLRQPDLPNPPLSLAAVASILHPKIPICPFK